MRIVITGGAGFLGRRLAHAIAEHGSMTGQDGQKQQVRELVLVDTHALATETVKGVTITSVAADICDRDVMAQLITDDTDSVYHLAAIVSGQAEVDFDLGYRVNLDGTRTLLELCRAVSGKIKFITTSSVAAYGGDMPDVLADNFAQMPTTSYGGQKAISEILVNDYSRKGFIDGRALRLPTIIVRPGKPNAAASSFFSSIFREPLQGERAVCPVNEEVSVWIMSPRRVIQCLIHAHELVLEQAAYRSLTLPGISITVGAMIEALERAGGKEAVQRIDWKFDPKISDIATGWPGAFEATRALEMGFRADNSIDDIIQAFIEDDMPRS